MNKHFIRKTAIELNAYGDNIVKTAGILRQLKNKILNFFSSERQEEANKLINSTAEIKPLLVDTMAIIKNIESSINDLDVESYDMFLDELKQKITELSSKLSDVTAIRFSENEEQKISNKPPESSREGSSAESPVSQSPTNVKRWQDYKREFAKRDESYVQKYYYDNDQKLDTLEKVGAKIGKDIRYPNYIRGNVINVTQIFASWALQNFTKDGFLSDEELLKMQNSITKNQIEDLFYSKMHEWKIRRILGPEMDFKKDNKEPKKHQKLNIEIAPTSPIALPAPFDNWLLQPVFYVEDRGDPEKPGNFVIYRQYIIKVKNTLNGAEAYNNKAKAATSGE